MGSLYGGASHNQEGMKNSGGGRFYPGNGEAGTAWIEPVPLVKQTRFLQRPVLVRTAAGVPGWKPSRAGDCVSPFLLSRSRLTEVSTSHCPRRMELCTRPTCVCSLKSLLRNGAPSGDEGAEVRSSGVPKYNLIWAKWSPQDPKKETRGHLQPLITWRR